MELLICANETFLGENVWSIKCWTVYTDCVDVFQKYNHAKYIFIFCESFHYH